MSTVTIQLKRGLKANLPADAAEGEPLVTLDTKELWVGQGIGSDLLRIDLSIPRQTSAPDYNETPLWIDTSDASPIFKYYDSSTGAWIGVGNVDSDNQDCLLWMGV